MTQHSGNGRSPRGTVDALQGASIAVVGAGGVGMELLRNLERMGVGRLAVFERDPLRAQSARGHAETHVGDFWDSLTLARLQDFDFVACTVRDANARSRLNLKCLVANVSLLCAWTDGDFAIVSAHPFALLPDCACADCRPARGTSRMPIASLRLSVDDDPGHDGSAVAAACVAGGLAAALLARIASGSHDAVARRATLDTGTGEGTSVELRRDPACPRCGGLERPVAIVRTRNCWTPSAVTARACPEALEQCVELSDAIEGCAGGTVRLRDLSERYGSGPVPVKFALADFGGRRVCLDFEDAGVARQGVVGGAAGCTVSPEPGVTGAAGATVSKPSTK